jgi:hypothetical protein
MKAREIDKYKEVAEQLHMKLDSFQHVGERMGLTVSEVIYLLKADRKSMLKKFKNR